MLKFMSKIFQNRSLSTSVRIPNPMPAKSILEPESHDVENLQVVAFTAAARQLAGKEALRHMFVFELSTFWAWVLRIWAKYAQPRTQTELIMQ